MKSQKLHRYIGLAMLIPMLCWAATGVVFFIKPGYKGAYERLNLKTYPIEETVTLPKNSGWTEVRLLKSILGSHLLVKSYGKTLHLDPDTLELAPIPGESELKSLFEDITSHNLERYGSIARVEGTKAYTSNDIEVALDWNTLSFTQKGKDREIIGILYKVHYLQWTPWDGLNQVIGILGLILLTILSVLGIKLYISNKRQVKKKT
ncbi:PepSY domain-containing protein [Aliikangiella sp. G2MR2-5]|uniref:PepSY domain-containing protein n=1 Tax=Aliikangiella sp. G2MR2-5 TaxID=2788943 RepID=UPI0018AB4DF6|nr:PepSY domain-containing protein [Aliikangiella sp. G2MR2-5]